jgi:hypothetical protein
LVGRLHPEIEVSDVHSATFGEQVMSRLVFRALIVFVMAVLVCPATSFAQLNGQNIKGDIGVKSGSQAPPGWYVAVPLYFYTADQIKDRDGKQLATGSLDSSVFGIALSVVTKKKILGGTYGFVAALPWANNRVQGAEDFDADPGTGITDSFIQPINLGWHTPKADAIVAYGLYIPTGRYEDGASNNTGLGMWAQELLFGTTVYLNEKKSVHAAATVSFDFQSKKKDSTTKVGNIMNLEGGVGGDFLKGGLVAGLAYYGTFKLTDDHFANPPVNVLLRGKNSIWGLGPEFTLALVAHNTVYGFATVRYQWELAGRTTTEGGAWNLSFAFPLKPIHLP